MKPVIVIRPEPGCGATCEAARKLGLAPVAHPLSEIRLCHWDAPDPASVDGLLIGSANALRFGGADLALYQAKPVHAVGKATLAAALACGLAHGSVGEGGLQQVLDALPPAPLRLLRLAGAEHVALDVPAHVTLITRIVYKNVSLPVTAPLASLLHKGALVLLHSASAARHFSAECDRLSLPRAGIGLAALGPRIAMAAGEGWEHCATALQPSDSALLAMASEMCH